MNEKKIKKIPYGLANYAQLVQTSHYYVDKTRYLKTIEDARNYVFLIRPRRFGKSLFLSVMEAYYDLLYKDKFDQLFTGTWVHDNPTAERGKYLVLPFNFSAADPTPDKVETSVLNHIRGRALSFIRKYAGYLLKDLDYFKKNIEESRSGSDILSTVIDLCKDSHRELYVFIDEYDNFANTILSTSGETAYQDLTHGDGFFKSFFNVLKVGTTGIGAPINRLFLTGVSPVTLDDVTSGYNIGENVSIDPAFNQILGFTESEVRQMLEYYKSEGLIKHETPYLLEIIAEWYGGYLFSEHSIEDERLHNSDMVLYFLKEYFKIHSIPGDLIDRNVRVDYGKLKHLILVDKGKSKRINGNFSKLKEIIEKGETSAKIAKGFPLEELADTENFTSLLFYLGLLTIEGAEKGKVQLKIPNETVKRLYYDYIKRGYGETELFDLDLSRYSDLMADMAYDGTWEPLFDYIAGRMRGSMGLRDLMIGEKSIQAFLNVYLGLSNLYIVHPEKELNKGYADIVLEPFLAAYEGIKYSYLLEIKYIKASDKNKSAESRLRQLKEKAELQLKRYSIDDKFKKSIKSTTLVKLVLIFRGHELIHISDVDNTG